MLMFARNQRSSKSKTNQLKRRWRDPDITGITIDTTALSTVGTDTDIITVKMAKWPNLMSLGLALKLTIGLAVKMGRVKVLCKLYHRVRFYLCHKGRQTFQY